MQTGQRPQQEVRETCEDVFCLEPDIAGSLRSLADGEAIIIPREGGNIFVFEADGFVAPTKENRPVRQREQPRIYRNISLTDGSRRGLASVKIHSGRNAHAHSCIAARGRTHDLVLHVLRIRKGPYDDFPCFKIERAAFYDTALWNFPFVQVAHRAKTHELVPSGIRNFLALKLVMVEKRSGQRFFGCRGRLVPADQVTDPSAKSPPEDFILSFSNRVKQ